MKPRRRDPRGRLGACALALLVAGCHPGSGGDAPAGADPSPPVAPPVTPPTPPTPPPSLDGVVVGSYFRGAVVCADANANARCDAGELATVSGADGRWHLPVASADIVAEIGTDAMRVDADSGAATPVSARIVLRAPRQAPSVVSVHSTAVLAEMESSGLAFPAAVERVAAALGVTADRVLTDFNREPDARTRAVLASASAEGLRRIERALARTTPGEDPRARLAAATGTLSRIGNVVVIVLENRSFDHLYGLFPGADGIARALADPASYLQRDRDGSTPLPRLPAVWSASDAGTWSFVAQLPNRPFRIDDPAAPSPRPGLSARMPDLVHRFYNHQMQIGAGAGDGFAAWSDAGGLAMGHFDGASMQLWSLARQYTLADRFFQGAFGGSFLNHFYLVCACEPVWADPPAALVSAVEASGTRLAIARGSPASALDGAPRYVADRNVSAPMADGRHYAVNTTQPPFQPSGTAPAAGGDARLADPAGGGSADAIPLPMQTAPTIGDRLSAKGVDWKWYAGGWRQARASRSVVYNGTAPNFQAHHQPFNYFARFDPTTVKGAAERAAHLKDYDDLVADAVAGTLPPVAFYKPQGNLNQHPSTSSVSASDAHVADLIARLQASPQWPRMLVIVTYDENGGFWDHVAPPAGDAWGPGSRVPAIVVSDFARRGYVDSQPYDTTSILKLITRRFGLEPLPGVRPDPGDLSDALDLLR